MNNWTELQFGESHDPGEVFEALSARYTVIAEPITLERWLCLDTADWRLHRAGLTLQDRRHGRGGELVLSVSGREWLTTPSRAGAWPRLVDVLAPSPIRDHLVPAVGLRALLPMATVDARCLRLRLLDDAEKTRVRIEIHQQRLKGGTRAPLPLRVVLAPLRGYERDGQRCTQLLLARMPAVEQHDNAMSAALLAAGRLPGVIGQRARIDPLAPAARSIAAVLTSYLDIMDTTREGVIADVDVEFLRELRASLRATRAILSLMGDALPGGPTEQFVSELARLARLTAPVRDLDLFLLQLRGHGGVDVGGLAHLQPLRDHLVRRRRHALDELRESLASPSGRALADEWREVLEATAKRQLPGTATTQFATARAQLAHRRIGKAAAAIDAATPPEQFRALRRRCQRLRYLLDGFSPAFETGATTSVMSGLRRVQDRLGTIQDSDVQRHLLIDAAATLARRGVTLETMLALGALQDRIVRPDLEARRGLNRQLARFCGPAMKGQVAALQQSSA